MLLMTEDQLSRDFAPNSHSRRGKRELYGHNSLCKGRVWFVKDSLGVFCAAVTWGLMLYAEVVVCGVNLLSAIFVRDSPMFGIFNLVAFNIVFALAFIAHTKTVFSNPGVVRKHNFEDEISSLSQGTVISKCVKCESVKPERAHHCSICDRCVHRMDHHCPWVNNCIGERNQKYFILFTFYIALMSIYTIFIAAHLLVVCTDSSFIGCTWLPPAATLILNIIVLFEGILFSMFTLTMCGTQICSIWYDETTIESLKQQMQTTWMRRTRLHGMRSVFGHKFSWEWLSPLHAARMWWKDKLHHV